MAERPQPPVEGWTVLTSLTYLSDLIGSNDRRYDQRFNDMHANVDQKFQAQREAVVAAMTAASVAVSKAEAAAEKRLDAVNEFRGTLADQQRNLMPRAEAEATMHAMQKEIADLKQQIDSIRDRGIGVRGGWGYAVGAIGLLAGTIGAIMTGIALFEKAQR